MNTQQKAFINNAFVIQKGLKPEIFMDYYRFFTDMTFVTVSPISAGDSTT
jgi:hypothetical protein